MSTRPERPLVKSRWSSTTTTRIVSSPSLLKNLFTLSAQLKIRIRFYRTRCSLRASSDNREGTRFGLLQDDPRDPRLHREFRSQPLGNLARVIRLSHHSVSALTVFIDTRSTSC